jgi:F-type H+-transporting ATPase subunit gamma
MRRANVIQRETSQITTVESLIGAFEGIASTQVAKIKDKVELSKEFFDLLWERYSSIRADGNIRIASHSKDDTKGGTVFVIISAEAGLSGDIDQRLIEAMLEDYDNKTDIIVLGTHGANQLQQRGIAYIRYFRVPESENYVDVSPVIEAISSYSKITVYYEEYISLGVQGIKKIDLYSTLQAMSQAADKNAPDVISTQDTIFEPSLDEIADLMEKTMMTLAFSQAILESSLAQDASRFNAMAGAKKRAMELVNYYKLEFHRAKRSENDRRSREVIVGIKKKKHAKRHR